MCKPINSKSIESNICRASVVEERESWNIRTAMITDDKSESLYELKARHVLDHSKNLNYFLAISLTVSSNRNELKAVRDNAVCSVVKKKQNTKPLFAVNSANVILICVGGSKDPKYDFLSRIENGSFQYGDPTWGGGPLAAPKCHNPAFLINWGWDERTAEFQTRSTGALLYFFFKCLANILVPYRWWPI